MKRILSLLLVVLLLTGCTKTLKKGYQADQQVTNLEETGTAEEILANRRKIVVDEMRDMMSLLWTPKETFTYDIMGDGDDDAPITFEKGKIYSGIPYATGDASRSAFLSYAVDKKDGIYVMEGLSDQIMSGGKTPRVGNTCSNSVFWSWARVSNSISFEFNKYMTPTYGCIQVGDYVFEGSNYDDVVTSKVCEENGEAVMFASYAQMLPGDAMVYRTGNAGHAVMVVDVNVVYDGEGNIDPESSTVTIVDQSGTVVRKQETTYMEGVGEVVLCEKLDKVRTFASVFKRGYLPVTCQELIDPSPLEPVTVTDYTDTPTADNMFKGAVQSSYRISHITVDIYNEKGGLVQTATCYSVVQEMYTFNMYRFIHEMEQPGIQGSVDIEALPSGNYRCVFTARMSTGNDIVFRDFTITK